MSPNALSMFDLTGQVALVTGGAGHLGKAISSGLASAGARVILASRDADSCRATASELAAGGVECRGMSLDITSGASAKELMAQIKEAAGGLDILVNNAAAMKTGEFKEMPGDDFMAGIDASLGGVFRCTQAAAPLLASGGGGAVINIASMYGMVSPDPAIYGQSGQNNPPQYGAAKAGIIQLTRYLAVHLAKDKIRVNAISPGPFPKEGVQEDRDFLARLTAKVPLGRVGRPEELMGAVVYLASPAAGYVTGANLVVDGGWTAW